MTTQVPHLDDARDAWDAVADGFDRHVTPNTIAFGEQVLSGLVLGPGHAVLDVGAGSGGLCIPAARRGAEVMAVDISPRMVERLVARGRAEGLATLEARVGDGQALDLGDGTFDVALSLNGVSLFPDISVGLREMVRVTRAGGTVLVVVFGPLQRAEFIAFPLGAVRSVVPALAPPPAGPPMPPFRLADPVALRRALQAAGLSAVRTETCTWDMSFESAQHLLDVFVSSNPIARRLLGALTGEQLEQVRRVLDGMLRERSGGSPAAVLHTEMHLGQGLVGPDSAEATG